MFLFKRVQAQISEEHSTMLEILSALKRLVRLEKTFIFFGVVMAASIEVFYLFGRNTEINSEWDEF